MKFNREFLLDIVYGEGDIHGAELIEDKIIENTRWSIIHYMVFKYDGLCYGVSYSTGATEYQDEQPFEHEPNEIECELLTEIPVYKYEYVPVSKFKEKIEDGFGDLMTSEEMQNAIDCGAFIDDDGSGRYSDGEYVYEDFTVGNFNPKRSSHVVWYNK